MTANFDALSYMQQAPAGFVTEAMMPVTSFEQGLGNSNLAGAYMPFLQSSMTPRFGVGGMMDQPDNSSSLPGETTTLPASPEQPKPVTVTQAAKQPKPVTVTEAATDPFSSSDNDFDRLLKLRELEYNREDQQLEKIREMVKEANRMGQWNNVLASFLKDVPKALSEPARRRNMYLGDMLKSQADAAREQAVGIQQAIASMPVAPARNYIRI